MFFLNFEYENFLKIIFVKRWKNALSLVFKETKEISFKFPYIFHLNPILKHLPYNPFFTFQLVLISYQNYLLHLNVRDVYHFLITNHITNGTSFLIVAFKSKYIIKYIFCNYYMNNFCLQITKCFEIITV